MVLQKLDRATEKALAEASQAPRTWIALAARFPEPGEHVLVKMDDDIIEIGYWDSARAGWSHSPFERWGVPVSWSPLPPPRQGQ
ncbi:MAG: hypothetical protein DUW69_002710 [Verrucomicrobia bacterium]|jgi:hypothetical protein|nr:MAG: hypothetical protein DUW69_002710 [Verrucomicrobiota bacterium]